MTGQLSGNYFLTVGSSQCEGSEVNIDTQRLRDSAEGQIASQRVGRFATGIPFKRKGGELFPTALHNVMTDVRIF